MQTIPFPIGAAAFPLHRGVREVLESAVGQALLIANTRGEILFATRKARIILQTVFAQTSDSVIPNAICAWLFEGDTSKPFAVRHPEKGEFESTISHFRTLEIFRSCALKSDSSTTAQKH